MPETGRFSRELPTGTIDPTDPTDHLPLSLLNLEAIPPAPTRSASAIDWIPDFAGYSWVAYGASSLLVISHFPSPLSREEALIGPILRQVFELSGDQRSPVSAVSWSPVTPSVGELAAASENRIFLVSHDSASSAGYFSWSQNAVLVQSSKVEAIKWSGSGDGIISGGMDVVLWRRRNLSWEIAWKFKRDVPQNLVSATWSILGLSASAAYIGEPVNVKGSYDASKSVLVCYGGGISECTSSELRHPQPVSMVQWRSLTERHLQEYSKHSPRQILLTCCLDGAVRLWTEVDNGKVRKSDKDYDCKIMRRSFCVSAVIEINQVLNGTLGMDIFLNWATEIGGVYENGEAGSQLFSAEVYENDRVGRCEWLIGFGPGTLITFWAVHCLDDMSPMRFPRVTLWKRQELQELEMGHLQKAGLSKPKDWLLLSKVVILRTCLSGPPNVCSLLHLLPCNSLVWSLLYAQTSSSSDVSKIENHLSCSTSGVSGVGHTGTILQIAMHPQIYEVELAVSLDTNGLLLFWLVSTIPSCNMDLPTLIPSWKLCGQKVTCDMCADYTSVTWAPSTLGEDLILLLGHHGGIDCFLVKVSQIQEGEILCHFLCTIPATGHGPNKDGPNDMFAIPMPPTCNKTFEYHKFLLLGVWTKGFQALSWEVTLHSYDLLQSCCECNSDGKFVWKFEKTFASRVYCLGIKPCSSQFPEPHLYDQITSFSVVFPGNLIPKQERLGFNENLCCGIPAYTMATGCSDGSVKLWKSNPSNLSTPTISWEMVGKFSVHQGPISSICLADTGRKIATVCKGSHLDRTSIIHIWDTVHLMNTGSFILEDTISIDGDVFNLNWLALGNGQLVLGVCLQNELQVYAQRCSGGQILLNHETSLNLHNWSCIAVAQSLPAVCNFYWGPKFAAVIVHDSYFSIVSPWLFLTDNRQRAKSLPSFFRVDGGGRKEDIHFSIFADCDTIVADLNEPFIDDNKGEHNSATLVKVKVQNDKSPSSLFVATGKQNHGSSDVPGFWNLVEVAEQLRGILPIYHPQALLMNIYSGNWKRAYVSVRHLVECLTLHCASEKIHSSGKHGHIIPQILLSNYFEGIVLKDSTDNGFQWSADARLASSSSQFSVYNSTSDLLDNMFGSSSKSELGGFVELIEKLHDSAATEKLQILAIIDLLSEVQHSGSAYKNLDEPGQRFWVTLRFQQLHFVRSFGRLPSVEDLYVDTRLMSLAFHSDCHETLLSFFLPNEPSWKDMQTLGVGFWFTNTSQLRARMEKLARIQYLRNKDPKDCALLYVALNRLQVLAGLFRISKDEKDKPLVGFLSRNFQEEKNKAAALKNAYVLMGRHQLELAIAFFLLGGDTYSAITVCVKNLGDEQLALVICRLLEGCGGPLEHHLITKLIAPSARKQGDYWLASLLEWELGNYSESFLSMLDLSTSSVIHVSVLSSNHVAFVDPLIGLYCLSLAAKSSLRNAIGEQNAAILGRWATFMAATAFSRSGLPLEALECLSSPLSIPGTVDHRSGSSGEHPQGLNGILKPSTTDSSNWLSGEVSLHLESHAKLDLALWYFSKLAIEHPGCPDTTVGSFDHALGSNDSGINQYQILLESFQQKLYTGLSKFEQKFLLACSCIIKMLFVWMCNNGLWFIGYDLLLDYISHDQTKDESYTVGKPALHPLLHRPISKAIEDISLLLSRFITCCGLAYFQSKSSCGENGLPCLYAHGYDFQGIIPTLWGLKAAMNLFSGLFSKDATTKPLVILDIFEYCVHIASAWHQQDLKSLLLMVQPVLISCTPGHNPYEVDMMTLMSTLHHTAELLACHSSIDDSGTGHKILPDQQDGNALYSFSDEEKWHIIGTCLWQHLSRFVKHKLHFLSVKLEESYSLGCSLYKVSPSGSSSINFICNHNSVTEQIESFSLMMALMLNATVVHISSYHVRLFQSFLQQKLEKRLHIPTLAWVKDSGLQTRSLHQEISADIMNCKCESTFDLLWDTCADPNVISEACAPVQVHWLHFVNLQSSKGWIGMFKGITGELKTEETFNHEGRLHNSHHSEEVGPPVRGLFTNGPGFLSSWQKDATITSKVSHFQSAKEIYKRDGELLEALCINTINEGQAALASNRKGIIFFSWGDEVSLDQSEYIWSDADWPLNGWAGTEPTPVPTCVSPGIGLGRNKGSHLGLGGATIGMDSLARPRKDLTGRGAFGITGYAGISATGIGWEVQEDFEDTVDPPGTVENIRTKAFSSHPSRSLFLVGSSNTHIYLWEFNKDKATATYGVLPAANVPPPYALASVSALQFDHCGHRFASAALDGTVCTWQLEVGGRSNIHPTESSICFNGHASDLAYVGSSGSVIAAAGYSSNGVNAIIWDTLAPPLTSQASINCHEGGARSISVFDNDIGSGSISPLIVTGGKSGDVGLHDFRYIATGRTKRHRNFDNGVSGSNTSSSTGMQKALDNKSGDQNLNGMLWYIPKAHLGSVTKISTIPHTSLFLTGSKDGDVKLWDAKAAKMIYHWPKLHERHTFLQPSSRGYGGVIRVAVTDIQVVSRGFLTCGGDGCVKLVRLHDYHVQGM